MKIDCIVIEDEPLALQKVVGFIGDVEYLNLLEGFNNAVEAVGYLKTNSVDLIFLDIQMKRLTGIQFLESLSSKPKVIITSAYDEYALQGYELNVTDYLLKPFSFDRFLKSVEKVYADLESMKAEQKQNYIFVKTEFRIEKVELKDILFVKGMKDYLQINTSDKKIMTLQSFKNILQLLPDDEFVRVHNSYVVSVSKIENIERNRIRIGAKLIPISNSYKDCFYDLLKGKNYML